MFQKILPALAVAMMPPALAAQPATAVEAMDTHLPLVYEMPSEWTTLGHEIELEVTWGERTVHRESIVLSPDVELGPQVAFELVGGAPSSREWLRQLAADGDGPVFTITIGGYEVDRFGWAELNAQGTKIDLHRLHPIRASYSEALAASFQLEPVSRLDRAHKAKDLEACLEDCEDDYYACGQSQACQDDFLECANRCGFTGACTPTSTESSVLTPLGTQSTGDRVCTNYFTGAGSFYQEYSLLGDKYRRTTTTVATNLYCRQTTTVEITYVWSNLCWSYYSFNCLPQTPVRAVPLYSQLQCN